MSIGLFELVVVGVVTVLALKPEQLAASVKAFRRGLLKVRQYTTSLEQDILAQEKQDELAQRIQAASRCSDVSDLLPESERKDESATPP